MTNLFSSLYFRYKTEFCIIFFPKKSNIPFCPLTCNSYKSFYNEVLMKNQIFIFVNFENIIMTTLEMMDSILQYWKDNNAFQRSIDERSEQMQFRFFDGPPFAS